MYDPAIGRTFQLDPHADSYFALSPYSWVANSPLRYTDSTGMDIEEKADRTVYTGEDAQNMFRQLQAANGGGGDKKKEGEGSSFQENQATAVPIDLTNPIGWAATAYAGGYTMGSTIDSWSPVVGEFLVGIGIPRDKVFAPDGTNEVVGNGNESYPGPWSYTIPDPTKPLPNPFHKSPTGNRFPNNNPNTPGWIKGIVWGAGAANLMDRLGVSMPNISGYGSGMKRFYNDVSYEFNKFMRDFENGISGGWYPGR
jgi:hypothetical protein